MAFFRKCDEKRIAPCEKKPPLVITIPGNQFKDLPNLSNPSNIMTIPDKKVRSITNAGSLLACSAVMKAIIAAGPTAMSLEVPKMTYIKQPIKDE